MSDDPLIQAITKFNAAVEIPIYGVGDREFKHEQMDAALDEILAALPARQEDEPPLVAAVRRVAVIDVGRRNWSDGSPLSDAVSAMHDEFEQVACCDHLASVEYVEDRVICDRGHYRPDS